MSDSTEFKCECRHCLGHIACPAAAAGLTIECPHCGQSTELVAPPQFSLPRRAGVGWLGLTCSLLAAGLFGGVLWSRHFQQKAAQEAQRREQDVAAAQLAARMAATAEARANAPFAKAGFGVSSLQIEKDPGSSIIHAVGTLTNETAHRRFGVKIQLDLFDDTDQKIGAAKDYQPTMEPGGQWHFKALVVNSKAAVAKLVAIEESQ